MDEPLVASELGQETYDVPGHPIRVRVVHIPSGTFGEAAGERWEQLTLIRKARAELAQKLSGGGGTAGVPAKISPGPRGPNELAAQAELPRDDAK
jgi:lipid-binding SYLF domain-containing protein